MDRALLLVLRDRKGRMSTERYPRVRVRPGVQPSAKLRCPPPRRHTDRDEPPDGVRVRCALRATVRPAACESTRRQAEWRSNHLGFFPRRPELLKRYRGSI